MQYQYTFLTSIYKNTSVKEMIDCVSSMENQTIKPEQIVIVCDGPLPNDLVTYIDNLILTRPELYTVKKLKSNMGLGLALNEGMKVCRNELIARMDTDDICVLDRCEKQLKCFEDNQNLSIVGSNIAEFIDDVKNIECYRNVPQNHEEICNYLKSRCPFNHMTVMFKKNEVEKSGGYLDWHFDEDSYLWVRMFLSKCVFYNIQENLVFARINSDTFKRRGGYKYYKSEIALFKFMKDNKVINLFEFQKAKFIRFVVQVLMTNSMRQFFFKKFARKGN